MPSEFMDGFVCGIVPVLFALMIVAIQDYKRKYGGYRLPEPIPPLIPPVIDAEFVTNPSSQALARQHNSVPRVNRSTEIIGREYGK